MTAEIMHIVGARPQFVKYFPVQEALRDAGLLEKSVLVHTGQHYDLKMSEIFFRELGIAPPDFHLGVGSAFPGEQTATMLQRIERLLLDIAPRLVVIYGDTNSTLAGALAASKAAIPLMHVESGLRSYDRSMPEEINRIVADHLSTILACPTRGAIHNLWREGFSGAANGGRLIAEGGLAGIARASISRPLLVNTGDIMYDLLQQATKIARLKSHALRELDLKSGGYCLLTIHRAENCDNPGRLFELLEFARFAAGNSRVIFPVHPRTARNLKKFKTRVPKGIELCEPFSYFDMVSLLQHARLLLTDSGGLQKEAFWLKVPCVTLREQTEWTETVTSGWNVLYKNFKGDFRGAPGSRKRPFGDGRAAPRIAACLRDFLQGS